MRFSLKAKIIFWFAGVVAILAGTVLVGLAVFTGREINRGVGNDVHTATGVLAQFIHERSRSLQDQSQLLARQPALMMRLLGRSEQSSPDFATVTDCLREWLGPMRADGAVMTDQDGKIIGDTDNGVQKAVDVSGETGVQAAMDGNLWSGVVERNDKLMLAVTVPVVEPVSRYVRGTFTAYSAIDSQVAKELKASIGSDVAFVNRGLIASSSIPLPSRIPTPSGNPKVVKLNHNLYFALYAPFPGMDTKSQLGFVLLRSYSAAMHTYNRLKIAFFITTMAALLLAAVAGIAAAGSITRPLDGLVNSARMVQEGEWPEAFVVERKDEIGLLQSVFNEMTSAMKSSREHLLSLIDTDLLTGLDNHRRFQERLGQEVARCAISKEDLTILIFDLDHFQEFNQKFGHAAGDDALKKMAVILTNSLPEVAITARYGGEEFAALVPHHSLDQGEIIAEKIRSLASANFGDAENFCLTVSIGCAEFGSGTAEADGLILAAELALSSAKQLGRNRVCRFDSVPGAGETGDPYQLHKFLQDSSFATIQALAAAVDAKDPYTQGHSKRVAEYSSSLAKFINLTQAEVELIYTTGTLHDVGKIGVPDAILKKPGRLEDEERAVMETHPVLGEVIIKKAPALSATLPGVRHHHERWDGKGYPDNLAGTDIPHMARILAVADTFDAMTSDRPYRKGLAWDIALSEISKGAGTQFDPELAASFVSMMDARQNQKAA